MNWSQELDRRLADGTAQQIAPGAWRCTLCGQRVTGNPQGCQCDFTVGEDEWPGVLPATGAWRHETGHEPCPWCSAGWELVGPCALHAHSPLLTIVLPDRCGSVFELFNDHTGQCLLRCILDDGDGHTAHRADPNSGTGHDCIGWTDDTAHPQHDVPS